MRLSLAKLFSALGALSALAVSVWLWASLYAGPGPEHGSGPGLYVLEMVALFLLAAAAVFKRGRRPGTLWARLPWAAAGAATAFAVLGLFSIGPAFAPAALWVGLAALAGDLRQRRDLLAGAGVFFAAGVAQAAVMLAFVAVA